jgi:ribosome-associated protein
VVHSSGTPERSKEGLGLPATTEAVEAAVAATRAADEKKASDLEILEVADILAVVDLFALVTASNERHLKALADEVERALRDDLDRKPLRREGSAASGWMLLDYGDIVVHLFDEDQRGFYALERLWADVPRRDPFTGEQQAPHTAEVSAEA